jgi:hypothetical protein
MWKDYKRKQDILGKKIKPEPVLIKIVRPGIEIAL